MTYTTIELRSIANALISDGQELVTGMERSEVRDYLLYHRNYTLANGPLSDAEIDRVVEFYHEERNKIAGGYSEPVSTNYVSSSGEGGGIVEGAIAAGIVGVILAIWGFFKYESRKYIMPIMLFSFTVLLSFSSMRDKYSDAKIFPVLFVIICLAIGTGLSFVFKAVDKKVSSNGNKLIPYAFVPLFISYIISFILSSGVSWMQIINVLVVACYTALMILKKEKIASYVIMAYFANYFISMLVKIRTYSLIDIVNYTSLFLFFVICGLYLLGYIKKGSKLDKVLSIIIDVDLAICCIFYARAIKIFYMDLLLPARNVMSIMAVEIGEIFSIYGSIALAKNRTAVKESLEENA